MNWHVCLSVVIVRRTKTLWVKYLRFYSDSGSWSSKVNELCLWCFCYFYSWTKWAKHFGFSVGCYRAFNIQRHQRFRKALDCTAHHSSNKKTAIWSDEAQVQSHFPKKLQVFTAVARLYKTGLVQMRVLHPVTWWLKTRLGHLAGKWSNEKNHI